MPGIKLNKISFFGSKPKGAISIREGEEGVRKGHLFTDLVSSAVTWLLFIWFWQLTAAIIVFSFHPSFFCIFPLSLIRLNVFRESWMSTRPFGKYRERRSKWKGKTVKLSSSPKSKKFFIVMKKSAWISREKKMRHVKIINDKIYLVSKLNPSPYPSAQPISLFDSINYTLTWSAGYSDITKTMKSQYEQER